MLSTWLRLRPTARGPVAALVAGAACLFSMAHAAEPNAPQTAAPAGSQAVAPAKLGLRPGDRVALLGETLIEREQSFGYWETALVRHVPDLVVRNLGWSGDTPEGWARTVFAPPSEGLNQISQQVEQVQPTVVLLGYGMNASFDGPSGLERLSSGVQKLTERLAGSEKDPAKAKRWIVVSPIRQQPFNESAARLEQRAGAVGAVRDLLSSAARDRQAGWVDLFAEPVWAGGDDASPTTLNGVHLTALGYWRTAQVFDKALGGGTWRTTIHADRKHESSGATVSDVVVTPVSARFTYLDHVLPSPPPPKVQRPVGADVELRADHPWRDESESRILVVQGLAPGEYEVKVDGKLHRKATAPQLVAGVLFAPPDLAQVEALREAVVEKNSLYFHRWRPQNWTYLFGFRKHEQGNNAVEVPRFEELVKAQEAKIAELRKPKAHTVEITPVGK